MLQFVKAFLPGSVVFLIVAFSIGLALLWRSGTSRFGRRWLTSLLLLYAVSSIPMTAMWLAAPLGWGFHHLERREDAPGAQAIVILDAATRRYQDGEHLIEIPVDASVWRVLEGVRIYELLDHPLVFVSGGGSQLDPLGRPEASVIRDQLIIAGVPAGRIVLDSSSINTRMHAVNLVRMLREQGIERFVLVTSPSHMRRAIWAFQAEGSNPIPSPSKGLLVHDSDWAAYWPSTRALDFTQSAMHEYSGIVYYWILQYF